WTGVVAPAGTPPDVIATLNRAVNDGLQSAEMKQNLARFSAIAKAGTPQDFAAFMRSELPKWAELVKLAGATAERTGAGSCEASGEVSFQLVERRSPARAVAVARALVEELLVQERE